MKNIIILLLAGVFLLFSCAIDQNPGTETIKEIITETTNSSESGYGIVNQKIYPLTTTSFNFQFPVFGTSAFAGDGNGYVDVDATTKENNFIDGIFYHDNSFYSTDILYGGVWRTLDLSAQVGSQESKVTIYIKVVGIDASKTELNEIARFQFRSPDAILAPVEASSQYGDTIYYAVTLTTDTDGYIQWSYIGSNAYDAKTEFADPDYHDYCWMECEIWLYEYWKSEVVH